MGVVSRALVVVVVAFVSSLARAQAGVGPDAHGWFAVDALEGSGGTVLHLPPRGERGSRAGAAVVVRRLARTPVKVGVWDRQVYLVYSPAADRAEVYSLRVSPVGLSGSWLAEPQEGATAEPVLDLGDALLRDAAGWGGGLAVLAQEDRWRLWRLGGSGWEERELPEALGGSAPAMLVAGADELAVLAMGEAPACWRLVGGAWESDPVTLPDGFAAERVEAVFASGPDVCVAVRREDGEGLGVWSLGPALVARVAEVDYRGRLVGAMAFEGGSRLGLLCQLQDQSASGSGEPIRRWELTEVSLATGRVLYTGPVRHPSLEIREEVRLLSLMMLGVTGFMLFYLLRPAADPPEPVVPAGFVLAPSGRRLVGGLIDASLVAVAVAAVTGVPLVDFVLFMPLLGSPSGLMALVLSVTVGVIYSTLMEWLLGRTVGKLVLGMRVVSVDPARARLGLMRSGARNVFRWALAPWAVLGLGAQELRHRGDLVAGAGVVVRDRRESSDH